MNIILFFSILLITMSHPMTLLISVILLTLFVSMLFYFNSCNAFFPLILILLILGGMLVIFMYMVSLCPNKKINFNLKFLFLTSIIMFLSFNLKITSFMNEELMKIFFFPQISMTLLIMNYLMLTLMVVMKLLNWISSPLKSV
uniref:NADH dehydrogenase subunit 6 n=1 Tax=Amblyomma geoemydae TaxID=1325863 RepID=A0A5P8FTC0_9ACAR|nr:NADH dehydrogenase subunit 6 [Amblyomma geoemydae]